MVLFLEVLTVINVLALIGTAYINNSNTTMLTQLFFQKEKSDHTEEVKLELLRLEYETHKRELPLPVGRVVYEENI
jgi:hypothetical protein